MVRVFKRAESMTATIIAPSEPYVDYPEADDWMARDGGCLVVKKTADRKWYAEWAAGTWERVERVAA